MAKQFKLEARERVAQILKAALDLAPTIGYNKLTRGDIAQRAGIPPSLITYHLGTMVELRRQIMREAIRSECLPVIAQGITLHDRHAQKAPDDLKLKAIRSLL